MGMESPFSAVKGPSFFHVSSTSTKTQNTTISTTTTTMMTAPGESRRAKPTNYLAIVSCGLRTSPHQRCACQTNRPSCVPPVSFSESSLSPRPALYRRAHLQPPSVATIACHGEFVTSRGTSVSLGGDPSLAPSLLLSSPRLSHLRTPLSPRPLVPPFCRCHHRDTSPSSPPLPWPVSMVHWCVMTPGSFFDRSQLIFLSFLFFIFPLPLLHFL
jgi:hypothetical protein